MGDSRPRTGNELLATLGPVLRDHPEHCFLPDFPVSPFPSSLQYETTCEKLKEKSRDVFWEENICKVRRKIQLWAS